MLSTEISTSYCAYCYKKLTVERRINCNWTKKCIVIGWTYKNNDNDWMITSHIKKPKFEEMLVYEKMHM